MEHATISVSTVIAIITCIISLSAGAYGILLKFSFQTYEKATEKRFTDLEKSSDEDEKELKKEVKDLTIANHNLEKVCIKLEGEVKHLSSSLFNVEKSLDKLITAITNPTRYSSTASTPKFSPETKKDER